MGAALERLAAFAVARARTTIGIWLVVASLAAGLAASRLELATSNLDLIAHDLPVVAHFLDMAERLGTPNQIVAVLEADAAAPLRPSVERVVATLVGTPGVAGVSGRLPIEPELALRFGIDPYFVSRDGRMAFVFLALGDPRSQVETIAPVIEDVRARLAGLGLDDGVRVGLTGIPVYAVDDRDVVRRDTSRLSLLSLVLVAALFVAAFRSRRRPLLAVGALVVSTVVSLGLAALLPGRLTLVSASFLSILFGLGVDAGIHLVDRVENERDAAGSEAEAVRRAVAALAPGLFTSTITTASTLWALLAGGFRGFAELGLIAANGLLIALLATSSLLPALLVVAASREPFGPPRPSLLARVLLLGQQRAVAVAVGIGVAALVLVPGPDFDTNYLDLEPERSEAARLEREMAARSDYSPQSLVFTVHDRADLEAAVERLRVEPSVGAVRSLLDLELLEALGADADPALRAAVAPSDGEFAVWVFPSEVVWEPGARERFVSAVRSIAPDATGMPVLGAFLVERSKRALQIAATIGGLLLIGWLILDLRRPLPVALAALPPLVTAAALHGLMRLVGLSWNPIAVMALPVVLGIAVDDGVHLVHRFVAERGDLDKSLAGTGRSLVLTSLTTIAAFGTLGLAEHRGLASFGQVVALGVSLALLLSTLVLPQLLVWQRRRLIGTDRGTHTEGEIEKATANRGLESNGCGGRI